MDENLPTIPGYRMERVLGAGGMAAVFLATQETLNRHVAIKILANTLSLDERFRQRFLREAQIVAQLRNPNIMRVYEAGTANGVLYMVTEYYDGGTLKDRISGEKLKSVDAVAITRSLAKALGAAHDKGIFHRDIKPDNVLFDSDERFVLADFGIAKSADSGGLTGTGAIIGTPCYMSPEQFKGEAIDGRSDIYALGVLFYEMLTGKPPFVDTDPYALGIRHIKEPPPPLPGNLSQYQLLLDKMLAKEPDERFRDCHALEQAIDNLQSEVRTEKVSNTDRLREVAAELTKRENDARPGRVPWVFISIVAVLVFGMAAFVSWRLIQNKNEATARQAASQQAPGGPSKPLAQAEPKREEPVAAVVPATSNTNSSAAPATDGRPSQTETIAAPAPPPTAHDQAGQVDASRTTSPAQPAQEAATSSSISGKPTVPKSGPIAIVTLSDAQQQSLRDMDFQTLEKHFEGLLASGRIGELRASVDVPNSHPNADRVKDRFKTILTMLDQNGMPHDRAVLTTQDLAAPRQRVLAQLEAKARQLGSGPDAAAERVRVDRTILGIDPGNAAAKGQINAAMADFVDAMKAAQSRSNADAAAKIRSRALKVDPESSQF